MAFESTMLYVFMNFQNMPELAWPLGYFMALGVMGLTGAVLLLFFRARGWF